MSEIKGSDFNKDRFYQELEEKQGIINGISDALMFLDARTYEILDVNQAFLKIHNLGRYQVLGKTCHYITHHLPRPCSKILKDQLCPLEKTVATGSPSHTSHLHKDSDGNELYAEITSYPVKNADGEVTRIIHLSRDLTDRKRSEEALREESEKIKFFAYSVAHDLKSPTISLYGLTKRLCQNYGDALDERGIKYCQEILKSSEQIAALVDKINLFISTREFPLHIEIVPLKEVLQMIREEFSTQLQIREISWWEPDRLPEIKADRTAIIRLFRNLIDNALKYGGKDLSQVKITYQQSDEFHIFSVEDDGAGMNGETTGELFLPFKRSGSIKGIDGAGLGLAIVREIAERHGGKAWNGPGKERGAIFHVTISKNLEKSPSFEDRHVSIGTSVK